MPYAPHRWDVKDTVLGRYSLLYKKISDKPVIFLYNRINIYFYTEDVEKSDYRRPWKFNPGIGKAFR